jgi:hypothetical protein
MEHGADRGLDFEFDVCLSFAGEQRAYVDEVAQHLREKGIRVFYDDFERADMWGKDLYEHLAYIYSQAARYCVLFASKDYAKKIWTSHERQNAQARALEDHGDYVLPARFDETEIPGLRKTIRYESLDGMSPAKLADLVEEKLGARQKENFLPPQPDRLFSALQLESEEDHELAEHKTRQLFQALQRMSPDERRVVLTMLVGACPAELPENLHMSADLIRRITGFPPTQIKALLAAVRPLGFFCSTREPDGGHADQLMPDDEMLVLKWSDMTGAPDLEGWGDLEVAVQMVRLAREPYCETHADKALMTLNFTGLSTATFDPDDH